MGRVVALVVSALLLAGGGDEVAPRDTFDAAPSDAATTPSETTGPREHPAIEGPPPFRVQYDGHELELPPYTFCYGNACVDGMGLNPPSVGSPAEVRVFVPVPRFKLDVSFMDPEGVCNARIQPASVEDLGEGWYLLKPHGPAGRYRVGLFASGGGDMVADFLWDTPTDGALAEPRAMLGLIADNDGQPGSYGLELYVTNLATTPRQASATITVTASNGRSMTIEANPPRNERCTAEGSIFFDGPDGPAKQAAALGDFPFIHRVVLTIDGVEHVAAATYPDDELEDEGPYMLLDFEPPLPSMG